MNSARTLRLFAAVFAVCAAGIPALALAQSLGDLSGSSGASFTISVNPQYPTPYSQANISILSSTIDLTGSTMTVIVDGKNIYRGAVQPLAIPLGKAGAVTNIAVTVTSAGSNYTQGVSIQPQDVVLVAEPISSSPVLYPGKPLVPLEGAVRVVALANLRDIAGASLNPATLSYNWTVDGVQIADSSGVGKESVIVASPLQYRGRSVSVSVTSPNGQLVGGTSLSLSSMDPSVQIYENDPLLGIRFEHALSGSYSISGTEATLFAAPFSLPTSDGAPLLQWFLNGTSAQIGNSITLRPTGKGTGAAGLSLVASTGNFSDATAGLSLIFGAATNTNFFGL